MDNHDGLTSCGAVIAERNRYFTGKYMTARDFTEEQRYFTERHWLHNRLFHGWGIVCGLRVVKHPRADCARRWVVVRSGIAIDCCGHEISLPKDTPFELPRDLEPGPWLLCIRYVEKEVEMVPALYVEGECDPGQREANRIREVAVLDIVPLAGVDPECWIKPGGGMNACCVDDCDDELPGPAGICLEADCPCHHRVPLALITECADGLSIDGDGRRQLGIAKDFVTHIAGINWPHGGEVGISRLAKEMGGRLEIKFNRRIQATTPGTGVGPFTFVVEYGGVQKNIERLSWSQEPYVEDSCRAVFVIDPEMLGGKDREDIAGDFVYVKLKCDFILDCHGVPVDGSHLKGRLPSMRGVPGGVFESWFRVVEDRKKGY